MYAPSYVWAKILTCLEQELKEPAFTQVVDRTGIYRLTERSVTIATCSVLQKQILTERCAPAITEVLKELGLKEYQVLCAQDLHLEQLRTCIQDKTEHFTFERFLTSESNRAAMDAIKALWDRRDHILLLHGPSGVGKTHLLHAFKHKLYQQNPGANILCHCVEDLIGELIWSFRSDQYPVFRDYYTSADALLLDDVQFAAGRISTFDTVLDLAKELIARGKPVILASDRPLEQTIIAKPPQGLSIVSVNLEPPDWQLRLQVLRRIAIEWNLTLDKPTTELILRSFPDNLNQLEGALRRIRVFRDLEELELNYENVCHIIDGML